MSVQSREQLVQVATIPVAATQSFAGLVAATVRFVHRTLSR